MMNFSVTQSNMSFWSVFIKKLMKAKVFNPCVAALLSLLSTPGPICVSYQIHTIIIEHTPFVLKVSRFYNPDLWIRIQSGSR